MGKVLLPFAACIRQKYGFKEGISMIFHSLARINRNIINYKEEMNEYNFERLSQTAVIAMILVSCAIGIGVFVRSMRLSIPAYSMEFVVFLLIYVLFRQKKFKNYTLIGWYCLAGSAFSLAFYLSIFRFPGRPAATMLTILCIFPLIFMDRPGRFIPLLTGVYLIHSVCAFLIKGSELGYIDLINGLISVALGLMVGTSLMNMRLKTFQVQRQLVREKTTDVLTGVWNRRKLFEMIDRIKGRSSPCPSGVLMVDIDYFKNFNDTYGHAAGDQCLHMMGRLFLHFEKQYSMSIYRYGGEEFVAFLYGFSRNSILTSAGHLRQEAAGLRIYGKNVTVSIGAVYCNDPSVIDYEVWIGRADYAAYMAKNSRNAVVCWNEICRSSLSRQ